MSEFTLAELLLGTLVAYGVPLFGGVLLLGALGIPVPVTLLVLAAGAFARQGALDPLLAAPVGVLASAAGDCASFALGLLGRQPIERRFGQRATWQRAKVRFARRGGIAIVMSRVVVRPMALPVNLVAGSGGYPFERFALFALLGEALWLALYGTLGYLFVAQWEAIAAFVSDFSGVLVGVLLAWFGGRYLWRRRPPGKIAGN